MLEAFGEAERSDANFRDRVEHGAVLRTQRGVRNDERGESGKTENNTAKDVGLFGVLRGGIDITISRSLSADAAQRAPSIWLGGIKSMTMCSHSSGTLKIAGKANGPLGWVSLVAHHATMNIRRVRPLRFGVTQPAPNVLQLT